MDTRWEQYEQFLLDEFIENRILNFSGRRQVISALKRFAIGPDLGNDKKAICLIGEAGSGKSAIFASLYTSLKKKDVLVLFNSSGVGLRSREIHYILERWINELCRFLPVKKELSENYSPPGLYGYFHALLYEAGQRKRIVVMMDALDQLEKTKRGLYMPWLPYRWPKNTRFICAAVSCEQTRTLLHKPYSFELTLPHLTPAEIRIIANNICKKYHRQLSGKALQFLMEKRRKDGTCAAVNPLWLNMAMEEINKSVSGNLQITEADTLPATPEDVLFSKCLRAESIFGEQYTRAVLALLMLGHTGWRENDLEIMVPQITGEPWNKLTFITFSHHFGNCLHKGGNSQLFRFLHVRMHTVISNRYLQQKNSTSALHNLAAKYLLQLSIDHPGRLEIMSHLLSASMHQEIADYYGSSLHKPEFDAATHILTEHIGHFPHQNIQEKICSLMEMLVHDHPFINRLIEHLQFDLAENLEWQIPFREKEYYHLALEDFIEGLVDRYPHNQECLRSLNIACEKLGNLYVAHKLHHKAQTAYEGTIYLIEAISDRMNYGTQWQTDLAICLEKLGDIYKVRKYFPEALEIYIKLARLAQRMLLSNPNNSSWQEKLYDSLNKAGDCNALRDSKNVAHDYYKAALKVAERMVSRYPGNSSWAMKLSISWDKHGELCSGEDLVPEAMEAYESSLRIIMPVMRNIPANANLLKKIASTYDKLGKVYAYQGLQKKAKRAYKALKEIKEKLTEMGVRSS